jgi:bifunctional non-homologous end joining protein LigD
VRRFPRAPVSTPLAWSEVKPTLDPGDFNMANFDRRLAKPDPWGEFWKHRQDLKSALAALKRL